MELWQFLEIIFTLSTLTLWIRVLDKLIVAQLVKTFSAFYTTWRFAAAFTRPRHRSPLHVANSVTVACWIMFCALMQQYNNDNKNKNAATEHCSRDTGSYLGPDIDCLLAEGFRDFLQSIQAYAEIVHQIRPRPLPSTFFPLYSSWITLWFDAIGCILSYWQHC
jgi:hypothetical protein